MNKATNTDGAITAAATAAPTKAKKDMPLKDWIKVYEGQIARALPSVMTAERFARIATTALTNTPKLQTCDKASFIGAMLTAAQLGLEPNTPLGQAYLIPYGNKCQFQIGYKGLIDLAHRSGEIKSIEARTVYENDKFTYKLGLEPQLEHEPAMSGRGKAIWYYAIVKFNNGGYAFEVMSREDVEAHARMYSKAFNSSDSPWKTSFDEMAKKTVLKKVLKYAPLKSDFVKGVTSDEHQTRFDADTGDVNIIHEDVVEVNDAGEVVNDE